jgi:hypothetical protein
MTVANFAGTLPTATITTLNSTTGTIATLNSTTGTIATLNSTTGTIATFNSTTPTFLGAITASTNTINVGSGQIFKDASGNLGIGTASPVSVLDISNASDTSERAIKVQNSSCNLFVGVEGTSANRFSGSSANNAFLGTTTTDGIEFATNNTVRTIIDSSGRVGIGTASPTHNLTLENADTNPYISFNTAGVLKWLVGKEGTQSERFVIASTSAYRLVIDSSGNVLVGKTSLDMDVAGSYSEQSGRGRFTTNSATEVLTLNRQDSDGLIVEIRQANTAEGSISVSGTTVSYNGGHLSRWSQLLNGQRDPAIKKGTVLSNLDAMCEWRDADGNPLPNEQLNKVKISDVEGDSNTAGVFVNWDNDDQDNPYDLNMAMTGDMIIRIAQGTSVSRGDLLMSAGDGTAKPQGDDIIRSKTIAKVTSTNVTFTYEDGSYCVPCVLMAC